MLLTTLPTSEELSPMLRPLLRGAATIVPVLAWLLAAALPCTSMAQSTPLAAIPTTTASTTSITTAPTLRLGVNERVNVVYEQPRWQGQTPVAELLAPQARASLGLEFRSPAASQGPRSILRVQLSGDSVLNFRPRGGGMAVTYRSQF